MAETIVMIHGMYGGAWHRENYKSFFEQKGFQCHTPILCYHDIDPHDKPDPRLSTTSLLDYARDLEEYIWNLDQKAIYDRCVYESGRTAAEIGFCILTSRAQQKEARNGLPLIEKNDAAVFDTCPADGSFRVQNHRLF